MSSGATRSLMPSSSLAFISSTSTKGRVQCRMLLACPKCVSEVNQIAKVRLRRSADTDLRWSIGHDTQTALFLREMSGLLRDELALCMRNNCCAAPHLGRSREEPR